jgi:hypothetical protein
MCLLGFVCLYGFPLGHRRFGKTLDDQVLGDFGLSGGGAAGYELDRADRRLGTPDHAIVVASSEGHNPDTFVLVPEEHQPGPGRRQKI